MSAHTLQSVAPDTRMLNAERAERERLRIYQSAREAAARDALVSAIAREHYRRTCASRTCMHGYHYDHCALCLKRPGECDYGSCERDAAVHVRTDLERRPVCRAHAAALIMRGWKLALP